MDTSVLNLDSLDRLRLLFAVDLSLKFQLSRPIFFTSVLLSLKKLSVESHRIFFLGNGAEYGIL